MHLITNAFLHKDDAPDSAFKYSQIALVRSRQLASPVLMARSLGNLGAVETAKGNFVSALQYQMQALDLWKRSGQMEGVAIIKSNMADVYSRMKNYAMQQQLLEEAIEVGEKYHAIKQLGLIYTNLGNFFFYQGKYEKAIETFDKAIGINQKFNDLNTLSIDYSNGGGALFMLNKIDEAIVYYRLSLDYARQSNNKVQETYSYGNLGEAYEEKGLLIQAQKYYELSNQIAAALKIKPSLSYNYGKLVGLYKKMGDYKIALSWMEKKKAVDDSIMNEQVSRQVTEMQARYQAKEKQQQIDLLNSKNTIQQLNIRSKNVLLTGVSVFFVIAVILLLVWQSRKRYRQELVYQSKLNAEREEAAKALIFAEENERQRIASDLHDGVGQLFSIVKLNLSSLLQRTQFQKKEDEQLADHVVALVDESCKEVRGIAHQMMPNVLLRAGLSSAIRDFVEKIDASAIKINLSIIGLHERLVADTETVLYRVVQECVNNVIKHSGADRLDIQLHKDEQGISLTIEDNGKGFDTDKQDKQKGIGLQSIMTRVQYLKGTVDFSSAPGQGTLIAIYIPNKS